MRTRHALGAAAAAAGIAFSDIGSTALAEPQTTDTAATTGVSEKHFRNTPAWFDGMPAQAPELSVLPRFDQIRVRVLEVLAQLVGDEPITGDFRELDMNEYDVAGFLCDVEEEFDIYIPDQDADRLTSAEDVVEYIGALR
ncbi:acyl carrier protein [Nocardia tenerifensis]|uniref:Acyl carrier protein n=1 Tax=Nocardia tenerifensis TaxID=228006 RepID=A0A318K955_9NOCA|nr:hypothetical protein [Nocardia tenerifensis]PXX69254.1 acyl carrier protein [Nocardia tenerifensis]